MGELLDLIDVAAKNYPIKALAQEIGKAESTLRNELTDQPGYKLGLFTFKQIMEKTMDLRALDKLEEDVGRVAFTMPPPDKKDMYPIVQLLGKLSKQYAHDMQALAEVMQAGIIKPIEAERCLGHNKDLIEVCIQVQAYLQAILKKNFP